MTTELWLLFWSVPLYGVYLGAQALLFRLHYGMRYAVSARDEASPESTLLGRAERALKNFRETWTAFIVLSLIAHLADPGDAWMFWGAVIYLVGRVAYLPLYLWGVFGIRTLVWNVATIGLVVMLLAVLF